jgi:hypothetical protein
MQVLWLLPMATFILWPPSVLCCRPRPSAARILTMRRRALKREERADRLLGLAVLNPAPGIGGGSLDSAVDRMIEEARRCYDELGLRGIKRRRSQPVRPPRL